ncbi:hypothetical protein MtrunA17_Chr6g0450441 [Medicago truncatula]|uniref:Uncharacterized protein n=1 Tax=Medicago truncatula TaxID=3880 RepID=A0A396HDB4_MEDTR|nr:hypothetical protein MtrunA17_Chr6g0450441 [Medicago truncatula]
MELWPVCFFAVVQRLKNMWALHILSPSPLFLTTTKLEKCLLSLLSLSSTSLSFFSFTKHSVKYLVDRCNDENKFEEQFHPHYFRVGGLRVE